MPVESTSAAHSAIPTVLYHQRFQWILHTGNYLAFCTSGGGANTPSSKDFSIWKIKEFLYSSPSSNTSASILIQEYITLSKRPRECRICFLLLCYVWLYHMLEVTVENHHCQRWCNEISVSDYSLQASFVSTRDVELLCAAL